jgi:type IV pilus assembly protein PilE
LPQTEVQRVKKCKNAGGFTLTELMIAVAVVGILAGIAYPNYIDHVRKSRRADAQGALMGLANAMERYFTQNSTYVGAATPPLPAAPLPAIFPSQSPIDGSTPYYNLTIQAATATTYTLRAAPIAGTGQAMDGLLELDGTGVRRWDRNGDGDFADADEDCWEKIC